MLFGDLPAKLVTEFAALGAGLIPGVALAALAAVRHDTHRLLGTLNPRLDAAFLGHQLALPQPQDAALDAVSLVASEMRSIFEEHEVGRHVSLPILRLWLTSQLPSGHKFGDLIDPTKTLTLEQVVTLLDRGLGTKERIGAMSEQIQQSKTHLQKVAQLGTSVFCNTTAEASESVAEFECRMMTQTFYSKASRILTLGTIVRVGDQFLLCVQPNCDSVRLPKGVSPFPFLPLKLVDGGERRNFVVDAPAGSGWVSLYLRDGKPADLVIRRFVVGTEGIVIARERVRGNRSNGFWFHGPGTRRYRWVGLLKPDFAQRVAGDLADQLARVGVSEPESSRLSRG